MSGREPGCEGDDHCITCGDVALVLEVVTVDAERGLALCRDGDDRREAVETALVGAVQEGDCVLVHAGTALARVDDREAGLGSGSAP